MHRHALLLALSLMSGVILHGAAARVPLARRLESARNKSE